MNFTIKHLFNYSNCNIIQSNEKVNAFLPYLSKRKKSIAARAKKEESVMPDRTLPHHHNEEKMMNRMRTELNKVDNFQAVAEIFKQLGDPTRVRIFWLLCHCEECVINISAMLEMSSPAVSHHLRPLRNSGLVVSRRSGKEVYYRASDTEQSRLLHQMIELVMAITCPN